MQLLIMDSDSTFIDSKLYKAAATGQIDPFNCHTEPLNLLLTPTKNTILHIHITQQPKGAKCSVSFTEQILAKCPTLLLQTNNRGETPLHLAARRGHDTIVQCLIDTAKSKHQDIETGAGAAKMMLRMESIDRETALHEAVRHNNPTVVQILTEQDPNFTYSANRLGETPLYLAVERRYTKMAVQILETCSSPDFSGPNGRTALHEAVIRNSSEMTAKIIEAKKMLAKEVDQQGWTPLHHASHFGNLSIVTLLLEHDQSAAYMGDKDGRIPLHLASAGGYSHRKVVFSIIEHCPDCHELVDHKGWNVLHFAVQSGSNILLCCLLKDLDSMSYLPLLDNLVNQKDVDGNTPLHLLATYCFRLTSLIRHPLVDKMAVNNDNSTPLDIIAKSSDDHISGVKGHTLKCMKHAGGYEQSLRNLIELKDTQPERIEIEEMERAKTSHIIVAALIVTVTFTAGFTMPGGYDSDRGTAIQSRNGAFVAFIIADALAFILSTCSLFFYHIFEFGLPNRKKQYLLLYAGAFLLLSIFLMLIAFTAAAFAVLPSTFLRVIICVITSLFLLICYSPLKQTL